MNGPGRDEVVPDTSGFSLRSLPELLRLLRGAIMSQDDSPFSEKVLLEAQMPINDSVSIPHLPSVLLESKSEFCGGVVVDG